MEQCAWSSVHGAVCMEYGANIIEQCAWNYYMEQVGYETVSHGTNNAWAVCSIAWNSMEQMSHKER
jgi:hypothetical protein